MRLVDGEQAHFHLFYRLDEGVGHEAFGRDVKEFKVSENGFVISYFHLAGMQSGIDCGGWDVDIFQVLYLVFHERDERGDDDAYAVHCHCGHLETH